MVTFILTGDGSEFTIPERTEEVRYARRRGWRRKCSDQMKEIKSPNSLINTQIWFNAPLNSIEPNAILNKTFIFSLIGIVNIPFKAISDLVAQALFCADFRKSHSSLTAQLLRTHPQQNNLCHLPSPVVLWLCAAQQLPCCSVQYMSVITWSADEAAALMIVNHIQEVKKRLQCEREAEHETREPLWGIIFMLLLVALVWGGGEGVRPPILQISSGLSRSTSSSGLWEAEECQECECRDDPESPLYVNFLGFYALCVRVVRAPGGNVFRFGTNVHVDSRMSWLDFGGQSLKVTTDFVGQRSNLTWPHRTHSQHSSWHSFTQMNKRI